MYTSIVKICTFLRYQIFIYLLFHNSTCLFVYLLTGCAFIIAFYLHIVLHIVISLFIINKCGISHSIENVLGKWTCNSSFMDYFLIILLYLVSKSWQLPFSPVILHIGVLTLEHFALLVCFPTHDEMTRLNFYHLKNFYKIFSTNKTDY